MTPMLVAWANGQTWTNMASSFQPHTRKFTKGFDQSTQRHLIDEAASWDLLNMRPVQGRLEQTPWLYEVSVIPTNPSPGAIKLLKTLTDIVGSSTYLVVDTKYARQWIASSDTWSKFPVTIQTVKPNDSTVRGECLLYGISTSDFAADGDTIEVNIHTDGSHFRWRKNAGAYSSDLVIGPAVVLSGSLTVSFQGAGAVDDYNNYTVGNTWTWKRQDLLTNVDPSGSTGNLSYSNDSYLTDVYVGGVDRRIMRLRNGVFSQVGYSGVYGMHVALFYDHLFVSQYASGVYDAAGEKDGFAASTTPWTLGWSHLDNPDQFFATIINEADQKTLSHGNIGTNNAGITGLAVWRGLLYVFMTDTIHTFQYVGLPRVVQETPLNSNIGSVFKSGVIRTPTGIYFIGRDDFYLIKEFEPEAIGQRVRNKFFSEIVTTNSLYGNTFGFYNSNTKEVVWTYCVKVNTGFVGDFQQRQVVYSEITDEWYFRNVPCAFSGYSILQSAVPMYGTERALYGYAGSLAADIVDGATTGAIKDTNDFTTGATPAFTVPFNETGIADIGDPFHVKESSGLLVDAAWDAGASLKVYQSTQNLIAKGTMPMTALAQVWTPTTAEVRLSLPRSAYRQVAYRHEFIGTDSENPPYGGVLNLTQEFVRGPQTQVEK